MKPKPQHRKPRPKEASSSPLGDTRLIFQINRHLPRPTLANCPCLIRIPPPPSKCLTHIHSPNNPIVAVPLLIVGHDAGGFVVRYRPTNTRWVLPELRRHEALVIRRFNLFVRFEHCRIVVTLADPVIIFRDILTVLLSYPILRVRGFHPRSPRNIRLLFLLPLDRFAITTDTRYLIPLHADLGQAYERG